MAVQIIREQPAPTPEPKQETMLEALAVWHQRKNEHVLMLVNRETGKQVRVVGWNFNGNQLQIAGSPNKITVGERENKLYVPIWR